MTTYKVVDPCYDGDDVIAALESELNDLAAQGWLVVAVVPVRSFRVTDGRVQVSDDKVEALVLEKQA